MDRLHRTAMNIPPRIWKQWDEVTKPFKILIEKKRIQEEKIKYHTHGTIKRDIVILVKTCKTFS